MAKNATQNRRPQDRVRKAQELADFREQRNRSARADIEGKALKAVAGRLATLGEEREWRSPASHGPVALGSYENSSRTRMRDSGVRARGGAAWVHLDRRTRDNLRKDCQALKRNNVVARCLIHRHADFLVGDGAIVKPTASLGNADAATAWNKEVKKKFEDWTMGVDPLLGKPSLRGLTTFWQDLRAVADSWCTDGDRLACAVKDKQGRITLQYHSAESIVNQGSAWQDTQTMIGGVEFEAAAAGSGRAVAFHVAGYDKSGTSLQAGTWRLPAEACCFLPNPTGYDPEQVRGEPALQGALDWFDLINGFAEDTAMAATVATWVGLIFKNEKPADLQEALIAATANQPDRTGASNTSKTVEFGPGFSHVCKPGEGVTQIEPKFPTTNFKDFLHTLIQIVGADVGMPLAMALFLTGDLNFSSLRGVISMAARGFDLKQGVLGAFVSWTYRLKVQEWIALGEIDARDDWDSHTVKLPPPPVVDLKMESEAYAAMSRENLMPKGTAIELLGFGTHEEVIAEREREVKREAAAGVTPADAPGAMRPGHIGEAPVKPEPKAEPKPDPKAEPVKA